MASNNIALYAHYKGYSFPDGRSKIVDGYLQGHANIYTNDDENPWPFAFYLAVVDLKTMKVVAKSGLSGGDRILDARAAIDICKKLK